MTWYSNSKNPLWHDWRQLRIFSWKREELDNGNAEDKDKDKDKDKAKASDNDNTKQTQRQPQL